jgi:hypothetical protein
MARIGRKRGCRIPTCCLVVVMLAAIVAAGLILFVAGARMRVAAMLDEIRDRGELVRSSELELPDVPDDQNALLVYKRAESRIVRDWSAYERMEEARKRTGSTDPSQWQPEDVEVLRREVARNAEAIRLVRKGANMRGYQSDVDWGGPSPAVTMWDSWLLFVLSYKARVDLADGRIRDAIQTCADGLRIASQESSEPSLLCFLRGETARGIFLAETERIIRSATEPDDLAAIVRLLKELRPEPRLHDILAYERARKVQEYEDLRAGKRSLSDLLESSAPSALLRVPIPGWLLYPDEAVYVENMSDYVDVVDRPYNEIVRELAKIDKRLQDVPSYCPVARASLAPSGYTYLSDVFSLVAAARMRNDVLRTAAAVKLYHAKRGRYPDTLAVLVPDAIGEVPIDEFAGAPLRYEKCGGGFVVYSVGQNQVDDGGVPNPDVQSGDIIYEER